MGVYQTCARGTHCGGRLVGARSYQQSAGGAQHVRGAKLANPPAIFVYHLCEKHKSGVWQCVRIGKDHERQRHTHRVFGDHGVGGGRVLLAVVPLPQAAHFDARVYCAHYCGRYRQFYRPTLLALRARLCGDRVFRLRRAVAGRKLCHIQHGRRGAYGGRCAVFGVLYRDL